MSRADATRNRLGPESQKGVRRIHCYGLASHRFDDPTLQPLYFC